MNNISDFDTSSTLFKSYESKIKDFLENSLSVKQLLFEKSSMKEGCKCLKQEFIVPSSLILEKPFHPSIEDYSNYNAHLIERSTILMKEFKEEQL